MLHHFLSGPAAAAPGPAGAGRYLRCANYLATANHAGAAADKIVNSLVGKRRRASTVPCQLTVNKIVDALTGGFATLLGGGW